MREALTTAVLLGVLVVAMPVFPEPFLEPILLSPSRHRWNPPLWFGGFSTPHQLAQKESSGLLAYPSGTFYLTVSPPIRTTCNTDKHRMKTSLPGPAEEVVLLALLVVLQGPLAPTWSVRAHMSSCPTAPAHL